MSNPPIGNRFISEFHKDIVKAVAALPAPSAALAGFRRWRTSDNTEFFCDGTRWLSTELFSHPIWFIYDGSVNATYPTVLPTPTRAFATASLPNISLMPEDLYLKLWQAVAGSGSIFYSWTFSPFALQAGTVAVARDTKTIAASTWTDYLYTRANNNFVTTPATPAIDPANFDFQVTGATGKLLMDGVFRYRVVG